jgi:RNA polymerase sigma factor (sigma-70 family)
MNAPGGSPHPLDHLFRREHGRMVAVVTRIFGVHNLKLAEDVVQDAFCRAIDVWKVKGLPENPSAWLMATAKNRAFDAIRRERTARNFAPELDRLLKSEWTAAQTIAENFGVGEIRDDLLRMMFSCCHPALSEEAQVALILNILCGFSVNEIASAFVSTHAAVEKRITRAKHVLASSGALFEVTAPGDFAARLPSVHRALYLLFNEGYHGACAESAVRAELCREAIRLAEIILAHPFGAVPESRALAALFCLNAARLPARMDSSGNLLALSDQDRSQWDRELAARGLKHLEQAAAGDAISEYHLEAAIAAAHINAPSTEETDWRQIVWLYDLLMRMRPSPVVVLNRAIAIAGSEGPARGREALAAISGSERLAAYPFYPAALAEMELRLGNRNAAREHFRAALSLARNPEEERYLASRLTATTPPLPPAREARVGEGGAAL